MDASLQAFLQAAMAGQGGAGGDDGGSEGHVMSFKAGKCTKEGKMVTADKRKGLVYLTSEDNLIHFKWKERNASTDEDDLIMFGGEATWEKCTQCTTGRVYVLKFKSSEQRFFFWMQEAKESEDAARDEKLNAILTTGSAEAAGEDASEQAQFMQMLQQSLNDQSLASPTVGTGGDSETAPITSVDQLLSAASAVQITAGTAGPSIEPGSIIKADDLRKVLNHSRLKAKFFPGLAATAMHDSAEAKAAYGSLAVVLTANEQIGLLRALRISPGNDRATVVGKFLAEAARLTTLPDTDNSMDTS